MCGIAGIYNSQKEIQISDLKKMTDSIAHRGPDAEGIWVSENKRVGLGHRRLSILDLSVSANQPMLYIGRYIITYNGEIYNYIELKDILIKKGYSFTNNSDTEVILAGYDYKKEKILEDLDGMFAFAIYDIQKKELFCARDRFGEKPFYYTFHNGNLYFASEMKAFWAVGIPKEINETMSYNFLVNDLVENPKNQKETFYKNIYKLQSSSFFIYKGHNSISQKKYWKINLNEASELSFSAATLKFQELLELSVKRRLRADVPVGTSLSGGLDSSSVVSLVSKHLSNNHTFSARFKNFARDEGPFIDIVSKQYQTQHHNVFVDDEMLNKSIDKLIFHQEEPFLTGSIFAQYKVYERARQEKIIVMLDGQGADEYLCGYDKDFPLYMIDILPGFLKIKNYKKAIKTNHNKSIKIPLNNLVFKLFPSLYKAFRTYRDQQNHNIPLGVHKDFYNSFRPLQSPFSLFGSLKETMEYEMMNQGLEKLLKFADRNSMAHSVEVRLPFLNHELVQFIFSLPSKFLVKDGWSKAILRNAMIEYLPPDISYRKDKIGFEAPTNMWTTNKDIKAQIDQAKQDLIKQNIITNSYSGDWKVLMLNKVLKK